MEKITEADQVKLYRMQTEMLLGLICAEAYKKSTEGRLRVSTFYFANCNRLDVDARALKEDGEREKLFSDSLDLEPLIDKLNPEEWGRVVLDLDLTITKIKEL